MQKGEYAISIALAGVVVFAVLAIQARWQLASLQDVESSAGEFIMATTGIGQVPEITGYERVKTFRLGNYRAGLYRTSPAPQLFAPGRLVIYNPQNRPVFKLDTLEGSKEPWTTLYDFAGRRGLSVPGSRARPSYSRDLAGNREADVVTGQYSGGDHCCSIVTIVELGKESAKVLGRIEGLDGLPFEGLEFLRPDNNRPWEIIAHRAYGALCGGRDDAADIVSIYAFTDGQYTDQTSSSASFLKNTLKQNLEKWSHENVRTLGLLQTLVVNYAVLGQRDQAKRFFATNLGQFLSKLQKDQLNPNTCVDDVENFVDRVPSVEP